MMCQNRFILGDKCTSLVEDVDNGGGYASLVAAEMMMMMMMMIKVMVIIFMIMSAGILLSAQISTGSILESHKGCLI